MVMDVLSIVPCCYTYADGERVAEVVRAALRRGQDITLGFRGARSVPSSFVNAAFVSLLDEFLVAMMRQRLRVTDSSQQINALIRDQVSLEAMRRERLVMV